MSVVDEILKKHVTEFIKQKDELIKNRLREKGFNPDDLEFIKKHMTIYTYADEPGKEMFFIDNTHIITLYPPKFEIPNNHNPNDFSMNYSIILDYE